MANCNVYIFLLCGLLMAAVNCQLPEEVNVTEIENQLHQLAPGLEGFNASSLPSTEDVEKLIREKCEKNGGGEEAFNALKNQQTELQACLEQHLNYTQIQLEIEEAKKTGSMDEVFGKYCKKYPDIHGCMLTVTEKVKPCMESEEKRTLDNLLKVVDELKEFVCFKDGDRIAMFIAEGGVECLEEKKEELQVCANKTLGSRIPTNISVNNLPTFLFDDRACQDFDDVRTCFNTELEQCKDSTPANIVDAFFKFLKKHIPCTQTVHKKSNIQPEASQTDPNSSHTFAVSSFILVISVFIFSKLF